jgi:hypothetical protein
MTSSKRRIVVIDCTKRKWKHIKMGINLSDCRVLRLVDSFKNFISRPQKPAGLLLFLQVKST